MGKGLKRRYPDDLTQRIVAGFKNGQSVKQLAEELNLEIRSLGAIKANFTRGNYKEYEQGVLKELVDSTRLSLERDLQRALFANLDIIEKGLSPYKQGVEYPIEGGRIDILALSKSKNFVAIELKAGVADVDALTQLWTYMAWVSTKIPSAGKTRGIIIANEFTDRLKLAVSMAMGVQLKRYKMNFLIDDI
jgi:predicted RecB family endonuclease